ncbi:S1C family serine protease [Actinopolymorpha singaporensis]|uniref:Putative serine protease PepD n=1 Tax=Actinopolymorpha singaporensis TaxID=117157 RepID=A0A1H1YT87_9ACTN|nr:trypsin-like peptidase domain-containing protein [Actinopolymorpha singaporensis]SDT24613.1 putative serine protease PepD [Actinopolymorpha singaporensis]
MTERSEAYEGGRVAPGAQPQEPRPEQPPRWSAHQPQHAQQSSPQSSEQAPRFSQAHGPSESQSSRPSESAVARQAGPPGQATAAPWFAPPPGRQGPSGVPPQRTTRLPGYPTERPDFEPPPPWARPAARNGVHRAEPGFPQSPADPVGREGVRGRLPRRNVLIVVGVVLVLLAATLGATAGVLATLRWGPALITSEPQAPDDNLGSKGSAFPRPESVANVAKALLPSVVQISVTAAQGRATGSGFVLRDDGYILTNNHVVASAAGGNGIKVTTNDGQEATATVVGRSPAYDLAVIRVKGVRNLKPVALGDSDKVRVGEPVVALGSPLGLAGTVTSGIVSARNRPVTAGGGQSEMSFINALQTDAAINPGNSGGPLVNLRAQVIGVNSAIATISQRSPFSGNEEQGSIGLGFSIPIDQARRTADQIIRTGHAVYPVVGAVVDVNHQGPGARLGEIQPNSAAARAGLQKGDVVKVINGHRVTGADDLIVQIRSHVPGQRVELVYDRGGDEHKVIVTLGQETG